LLGHVALFLQRHLVVGGSGTGGFRGGCIFGSANVLQQFVVFGFKGLLKLVRELVKVRAIGVVGHAIVPDQSDVFAALIERRVLLVFDLFENRPEIHWRFDKGGVIHETYQTKSKRRGGTQ